MLPAEIVKRYRIKDGKDFKLASVDPGDTRGIERAEAKAMLAKGKNRLAALQQRLYADHTYALLIILQGLDAAGKDGVVEHVMSGVNPIGLRGSFLQAAEPARARPRFPWRASLVLPRRGHVGIFNRSYYEEVLVVRVHPKFLESQNLPPKLITKNIWQERFEDINAFELHLARNGIVPIKFFLHVSKEEQRKRLLDRIDDPEKQWKFNAGDIGERALWDQYMDAYQDLLRATATEDAPWYVVPADHKWFTRLVVAGAIIEAIEKIDPKFPTLTEAQLRDIAAVRAALEKD